MTDASVRAQADKGKPGVTSVALVGFMGAGKTTVGQALAERLGWRFLDLDRLIEDREGRTVEQIFRESGEQVFRNLERQLLRESLDSLNRGCCVLALGGGAFAQREIRELLLESQTASVFLDATVEELFRRSAQPGVVRPLRSEATQFVELYERRREFYSQAELRVDTGNKDVGSVIEEIISRLVLVSSLGANQ